jgi:hypothetical protein
MLKACFPAGTPITLPNGASEAIERLAAGDWVLSYEQSTHTLVPAQVVRRIDVHHSYFAGGFLVHDRP